MKKPKSKAGRKPGTDNKKTIRLYIRESTVNNYGGEELLCDWINKQVAANENRTKEELSKTKHQAIRESAGLPPLTEEQLRGDK